MIRKTIFLKLKGALERVDYLSGVDISGAAVERPREGSHGDYATNLALVVSRRVGKPTRDIAGDIVGNLGAEDMFERVEVAGPGFINFTLSKDFVRRQLFRITEEDENFGRLDLGAGKRVNVEFVSANPTGPLTVGHGRGATIGDTLANILENAGYDVTREYYFNDAGNQMRVLAKSVYIRYLQLLGEDVPFPEDGYQGDYIRDIAVEIKEKYGGGLRGEENLEFFKEFAEDRIFESIKGTLRRMGIEFDSYYNESSLYSSGKIQDVVSILKNRGLAYERDGALWFKATSFGADKDRVIIKSSGEPTYRLPDIAYHRDKFDRGFDLAIDILGADHHATYRDVKFGVRALGYDDSRIVVIIHQFVTLLRDGRTVKMSTRKANFVTLDELLDEVGSDAARYFFLMRKADSHLEFDLDLAKEQSEKNPVYYVQYAHARICSMLRFAEERGFDISRIGEMADPSLLNSDEEIRLIKTLLDFPDFLEGCTTSMEVHRLTSYMEKLASDFHYFYTRGIREPQHRVVTDDERMTMARLLLVEATRIVLRNALRLAGVSAPEKM